MTFPKGFDFGLKDKDGKPLCVGDKFRFSKEHKSGTKTEWINTVVWLDACFAFGGVNLDLYEYDDWVPDDTFAVLQMKGNLQANIIPYITKIEE